MAGKRKTSEERAARTPRSPGPLKAALANQQDAEALPEAPAAPDVDFLCFRIADRGYAVPVSHVAEVVGAAVVTQIPHVPHYILGVFNRHGRITAVLDLARFAGGEEGSAPDRIVVLEAGPLEAGVPVNEVLGIVSVGRDRVEPPLPHLVHESGFVVGQIVRAGDVLSVLDPAVLLDRTRRRQAEPG